jgi:hypothetical protein
MEGAFLLAHLLTALQHAAAAALLPEPAACAARGGREPPELKWPAMTSPQAVRLHACQPGDATSLRREIAVLFLMLVCQDSVPVPAPSGPAGGDVEQWVTTMDGRGLRVTGDALASDAEAAAVRVREDQLQVTEGAFLDTKGVLLGFDVLDCQDMAEAVQVASAHPLARRCVLEIRPASAE